MRKPNTIQVLNELLAIHYRSLPMYLRYAAPWVPPDEPLAVKASEAVKHLIDDHQSLANRFAEMILDRNGIIEASQFPMDFAELHLLSWDFWLRELVRSEGHNVGRIEGCVARLDQDFPAKALAEESLGTARGHLENLEELVREIRSNGASIHPFPSAAATHDQR